MTPFRSGRDSDSAAIIALIARCWSDYPGLLLLVDEEEPELRAPATHFTRSGGALWVADAAAGAVPDGGESEAGQGSLAGMVAVRPVSGSDGSWELCRMYVHPALHGSGLAPRLLRLAEGHAAAASRFELWSDTRFLRAHRFYLRHGYGRTGLERDLHDRSRSREFQFEKAAPPRPPPAGPLPSGPA